MKNYFRDPNKNMDGSWVPSSGGEYWPIHSPTYREYLEISTTNHSLGKGLRAKECSFWSHYLPQLLRKGEHLVFCITASTNVLAVSMPEMHKTR